MTTDRYQRMGVLAKGGMGSVELVARRDGRFRRLYARKRLLPVHREDDDLRSMFLDEARVAGLIRHPNVVSVLDVGEDADGPFLVMDLVEGVPLTALGASVAQDGPLPLFICLELARQIAEGLQAAHELRSPDGEHLRLIHRDLSPGNVLVGFDGLARITDFGIAKAAGQTVHTSTGILKGKPAYMAPEQLRFEPLDQRADLFSFGVVLFELLTGRRLYGGRGGDLASVARRVLHEPPPDLAEQRPEAPDGLVELLFELLAKEPEQRPASAGEVAERLREMAVDAQLDDDPPSLQAILARRFGAQQETLRARFDAALAEPTPVSSAPDAETPARTRPSPRRHVGWALAGLVLVAALAIAGWVSRDLTSAPAQAAELGAPPQPLELGAAGRAEEGSDAGLEVAAPEPPTPHAEQRAEQVEMPAEMPVEVPAETPAETRARRRGGRRAAQEPATTGVRTWSWQER